MNTSVVVAIITGIATLLAPILVKMTERDRREEIDKEIKILRQMNPESEGYKAFNAHIQKSLLDFAENDWLRSQYRNAYRRYIILFLLIAFLYFSDNWTASLDASTRNIGYQAVRIFLYFVALIIAGSVLVPLLTALFSEFKKIKFEWDLNLKKFQIDQLEKFLERREVSQQHAERENQEIVWAHDLPENEEQEYAEIYNWALGWALRGTEREKAVKSLSEYPTMHGVDAGKVANAAFDYFEEWSKKNEPLKFIEISRDAS